ncbi:efflux RND transporter permease subunit [Oceanobacter mangrovi]|uniref:efflux RND transporter permease subunit n=1 Tax=Oceanobacter mangrovi TaxID=2862510 RepID=UPI001C8D323C|nr:efflux RND transporter permease subunit [Oceanobacter mangrovi]
MSNPNKPLTGGGVIGWFADNPVAANLLMILVIALGIFQMGDLRREAFPSMEPDSVTVSISYDSGSAEQSEEGLAIKIEEALRGVVGIESVTSTSSTTGATVTVERQSDYDLDILMRDVRAAVDGISSFPADAKNPVISKAQREEHSLWIQLYGDVDRHTLQMLGAELESDLLAQSDITSVDEAGWRDPQMVVEIDEGKLQAYGLTLSDVEDAINSGSTSSMTAVLKSKQLYLQLQASEQAYQITDFEKLPLISLASGKQLLLGDVASIRDTYDDSSAVLSRFQGKNSIGLQVITTGQDDISDTVVAARAVVKEWIDDGRLPASVELETWYDRSKNINQRLELLVKNAVGGILLVFLLLALFLNLTVAFWVAMGLPFIFFGTLYFMGDSWTGLSLNALTTFGFIMALGIVVDDAVVVGESIYTERSRHGDTLRNTISGTLRVAVPTLFGVFTTVAAFFALANVEGHMGQLYSQFASIVTICLLLSLVESKLILPSHLAHLNTHRKPGTNPLARGWGWIQRQCDGGLQWFSERIYRRVIGFSLANRYAVAIAFIGLFVLVIGMPFTGAVRISFFPEVEGDTVRANLTMEQDASYGLTHSHLLAMEQQAYEVDKALGGNGLAYLQVMSESDQSGTITVQLTEDAPYSLSDFTRKWKQLVGNPEGVRSLKIQSRRDDISAFRLELRASADDVLTNAGEAFREQLLNIPGVSGVEDNLDPTQPQVSLKLNAQGEALGFTTAMLAQQVLQAFSGQVVQRYQRGADEIEVKVRYPEADRQNPSDVLSARVRTSDGTVVPLAAVATISYGYSRKSIARIDGKRAVYMTADVDKDIISSNELVSMIKRDVVPQMKKTFPGLGMHFAGEAEEQAKTQSSMIGLSLLALLVIYMLLAIPLKSYVQPVIIMTAIPFGIVGAILGHWLFDIALGIQSFNGIIALSGVVVNDSLLLVARYNDLKTGAVHNHESISTACRDRLRAVLLTSFTTFAGLMPLLGETDMQAQFLIPAAVSLGCGIMFATVITLILIPALVAIQEDGNEGRRWLMRKFGRRAAADADEANAC